MPLSPAIIDEFKRLTREILTHTGPRGILAGLVGELVDILEQAANFHITQQPGVTTGETAAGDGLAISPTQAAMCATEPQRTAVFLRGLNDAITETLETQQTVHVLYAGCGPFATLATPLMALFPPDRVSFTILDLHPESISAAKSVVQNLGLEPSVASFVTADACKYTIPEDAPPDIILSETMSTALEREPQVAIMRHLLAQAPGARIIPESVKVDAYLVDTSKDIDVIIPENPASHPDRIPIAPVFELNAPDIHSWTQLTGDRLPAATIEIPPPPAPGYKPYLYTTITTCGNHTLHTHDSTLTGLREIPNPTGATTLIFHYRLGSDPCLIAEPATPR